MQLLLCVCVYVCVCECTCVHYVYVWLCTCFFPTCVSVNVLHVFMCVSVCARWWSFHVVEAMMPAPSPRRGVTCPAPVRWSSASSCTGPPAYRPSAMGASHSLSPLCELPLPPSLPHSNTQPHSLSNTQPLPPLTHTASLSLLNTQPHSPPRKHTFSLSSSQTHSLMFYLIYKAIVFNSYLII